MQFSDFSDISDVLDDFYVFWTHLCSYPLCHFPDTECEWISTSWLRHWLNPDTKEISGIDNSDLMCPHLAPDPLQIPLMKRISVTSGNVLFGNYGGTSRLLGKHMCEKCVENNRRREEFEGKLSEDYKFINKAT